MFNWQATDKVNINIASNWVKDRLRSQGNIRDLIKD